MPQAPPLLPRIVLPVLAGLLLVIGPAPADAFHDASIPLLIQAQPDSAQLIRDAREAQARFEEFRQSRMVPRTRQGNPRCDERIGRICHWFGGAEELDFEPERGEVGAARRDLISSLVSAHNQAPHHWILGQIVHYMVEDGRLTGARSMARDCGLEERWWCHALEGYVLHLQGQFPQAESAFDEAVEAMPPEVREEWLSLRYVVTPDQEAEIGRLPESERVRVRERLWRLSDPLFLVEGNDRLTDHQARMVLARIRREAENPFLLPWEDDLEEALIRYGRSIGWSRTRGVPSGRGISGGLQDNRQVTSHHDPASRGYLFPEEFLEAPAEIPPEAWITAPREARTWYAAPYAPDFQGLETQVARFRRGDSLLVVAAYRPDPVARVAEVPAGRDDEPFGGFDPFGPPGGRAEASREADPEESQPVRDLEAGLFLVSEDGEEVLSRLGAAEEGVLTLRAPTGRYVSSLELLDRAEGAAWRARQGITQVQLPRGLAGISDVVLLKEDAPLPDDLEEALPLVRPGIRVRQDERFAIAWEVYGLEVEDVAQITLGFTQGRPGFLRRVGEFLGVVTPDQPVEITFQETAPDEIQILFRSIEMRLPPLDPGEYTLHVRLELPGREPAIASRPIILVPGS